MNYTTKITTFRQEFKALGDHLESNGIDLTWDDGVFQDPK